VILTAPKSALLAVQQLRCKVLVKVAEAFVTCANNFLKN